MLLMSYVIDINNLLLDLTIVRFFILAKWNTGGKVCEIK